MGQPYIGEIRIFAGNFAPNGWAFCEGQLLPIAEYDTLFNLIGTTYGGDGQETFGIPDLRGRLPVHLGQGPGLSNYVIGQQAGTPTVTLTSQQLPVHNHAFAVSTGAGTSTSPQDNVPASPPVAKVYRAGTPSDPFPNTLVQPVFGSQPHENMMPFLCVNYILSLYGIYPTPT